MAGGTLALAEEEALSGCGVAWHGALSSWRIQRVYQGSKSIQLLGWQIERRHAGLGSPIPDQVAQLLDRPGTEPAASDKRRASVRAIGISSMAASATLRECFCGFRQIRWYDWRILCPKVSRA